MARSGYLFAELDLARIIAGQQQRAQAAADSVSVSALKADFDGLAAKLTGELSISRLDLDVDRVTVETHEAQVDVSHDQNRMIFDRSRPFYLPGTRIQYCVPFSGDPELFRCQPNTYMMNPPRAKVEGNELVFEYEVVESDIAVTKGEFQRALGNVEQYVGWVNEMVDAHNHQMPDLARRALATRLSRVTESETKAAELGYPVRVPVARALPVADPASQGPRKSSTDRRHRKVPAVEYDVALSFAGEDREYVEQVATLLKQRGVAVFYDRFEETKLWGQNLVDVLAEIYGSKSRFVVQFVSKHYAAKAWPTLERQHAQAKAIKSAHAFVLPVRFDDTEIPGMPSTVAYLDLRKLSPEDVVRCILQKLGVGGEDAGFRERPPEDS